MVLGCRYQGINDVFTMPCRHSPTGAFKFEVRGLAGTPCPANVNGAPPCAPQVQFHTPESFAYKMAAHGLYEDFRSTRDPKRKVTLLSLPA